MQQADEILDLDYDSPLELLFWFLGSPWCMGGSTIAVWIFCILPGKNGRPPIWADFPILPFALGMSCIWAVGFWLKANYDVRYQLDSKTQQLNLVRRIFGGTFKSKVAEFSQLHSAGVMCSWSDDKQGNRTWTYALCLITRSARMVRVSSWEGFAQRERAAELAKKLGIGNFPCREQTGSLVARRGRDGKVTMEYKAPPGSTQTQVSTPVGILIIVVSVAAIVGLCMLALH